MPLRLPLDGMKNSSRQRKQRFTQLPYYSARVHGHKVDHAMDRQLTINMKIKQNCGRRHSYVRDRTPCLSHRPTKSGCQLPLDRDVLRADGRQMSMCFVALLFASPPGTGPGRCRARRSLRGSPPGLVARHPALVIALATLSPSNDVAPFCQATLPFF